MYHLNVVLKKQQLSHLTETLELEHFVYLCATLQNRKSSRENCGAEKTIRGNREGYEYLTIIYLRRVTERGESKE